MGGSQAVAVVLAVAAALSFACANVLQQRIAARLGYSLVDHRMELYGTRIKTPG